MNSSKEPELLLIVQPEAPAPMQAVGSRVTGKIRSGSWSQAGSMA